MFILSSFSDLVVIDPEDFSKRTVEALEDQINLKYANKVSKWSGERTCRAPS